MSQEIILKPKEIIFHRPESMARTIKNLLRELLINKFENKKKTQKKESF